MATFELCGTLTGHNGAVTCLAVSAQKPDTLVSGSRDKTLMIWKINPTAERYGLPYRSLHGHSHFVEDVALSNDGQYALTGSWDGTMRLWDLTACKTVRRFVGHTKDILSVSFSPDNRQIISSSRDRTIKLWNILGECKYTFEGHDEWVSCVRFSPDATKPLIVSASWDKTVKIWDIATFKTRHTLVGHSGCVHTVAICPDGTIAATAGKDGLVHIWDIAEDKHIHTFETGAPVNEVAFSPVKFWLAAAGNDGIRVFDLESKELIAVIPNAGFESKLKNLNCLSLTFSPDGTTLYAGYNDNLIRVFAVKA